MLPRFTETVCLTTVLGFIVAALLTYLFNRRRKTATEKVDQKNTTAKETTNTTEERENHTNSTRGPADGQPDNAPVPEESEGTGSVASDEPPVMRCPFSGMALPGMGGDVRSGPHAPPFPEDDFRSKALEDPINYMQHIQGEVKRVRTKAAERTIQAQMTADQKVEERKTQQEQMEAIFKLMREQEEVFGVNSMDEMQQQMKLYM